MSWAEESIDAFFRSRASPSRTECDKLALELTGSSSLRPVDTPGSLSHTIICVKENSEKTVVPFRAPESAINEATMTLAAVVHGYLVLAAKLLGEMSLIPGCALLDMMEFEETLDSVAEEKQLCLVRDLSAYFARCWNNGQGADPAANRQLQEGILKRLVTLCAQSIISNAQLQSLEAQLPRIFGGGNRTVLAHRDLSETNILVDEDTGHITGIVDWSLAKPMPFGLELDALLLLSGYRDMSGWHAYSCRPKLGTAFWGTFWTLTDIPEEQRMGLLEMFNAAAQIGALLRHAFKRGANGAPSMELLPTKDIAPQALIWQP